MSPSVSGQVTFGKDILAAGLKLRELVIIPQLAYGGCSSPTNSAISPFTTFTKYAKPLDASRHDAA